MQKFNKITTQSNIIKNLLATTYIPLIRTVRQGDYICEDRMYVYKCEVIYCTESGYIGGIKFNFDTPTARWRRVDEYHFGDRDGKLSTNYVSDSEGYDYYTHERLGQYLRNLRDMYGLNLMPLYNCFSNQFLEAHYITPKKVIETIEDNNTKIYKVPIRFNEDYTICIENIGVTTFAPAFIRNSALLKLNNTRFGNKIDISNQYNGLHMYDKISSYSNLSYGKPIKLRFNNIPEKKTSIKQDTLGVAEYREIIFDTVTGLNNINKYFQRVFITASNKDDYIDGNDSVYHIENNKLVAKNISELTLPNYFYIRKCSPVELKWYKKVNNEYVIIDSYKDSRDDTTFYIPIYKENQVKKTYEIPNEICEKYSDIEEHLYLLIQVPKSFNSNITVLEGDYTEIESQKEVDVRIIGMLPDFLYDKYYTHDLSLMNGPHSEPIPFSPVLIEFLLWNSINLLDTINNNFDRLSIDMKYKYVPNSEGAVYKNYWEPRWKQLISDYVNYHSTNVIQDNIGYVTRDVEELISKDK